VFEEGKQIQANSFESICAIYESTLRFLALSYESIVASWLDVIDANILSPQKIHQRGLSLYNDIMESFKTVASPFVGYQLNYCEIEAMCSMEKVKSSANDLRQIVAFARKSHDSARSTFSLEELQSSMERLQDTSCVAIPIVESAFARLELLDGGYEIQQALACFDKVLVVHTTELDVAARILASTMAADERYLAEAFEEPFVSVALEGLKIAGLLKRELRRLEQRTIARLTLLADRMEAHYVRHQHQDDAIRASSGMPHSIGSAVFAIPDTLSMMDIDSFLLKAVKTSKEIEENPKISSHTGLRRLIEAAEVDKKKLYSEATCLCVMYAPPWLGIISAQCPL
jgi:hypothetical protein